MGGKKVTYNAPEIPKDDTFEKFLQYQQQQETAADARAAQERAEQRAADESRKASGAASYAGLRTGVENELRQGLLTYEEATQKLRDYSTKYDLGPVEGDVSQLSSIYTQELLPGRRATSVGAAYEEILGRPATAEEQAKAMERFNQGYYTSNDDLRNSLYKGSEYTDKFNKSYLDNYYDTMYGQQTTDEKGKKTGERTFKFSSSFLPQLEGNVAARAGVITPTFGNLTGTAAELEEQTQSIRDTRQFLYSAGLTNLQGEIDKETQKLKNEGSKELAKVQSQGAIYSNLVGSFSF